MNDRNIQPIPLPQPQPQPRPNYLGLLGQLRAGVAQNQLPGLDFLQNYRLGPGGFLPKVPPFAPPSGINHPTGPGGNIIGEPPNIGPGRQLPHQVITAIPALGSMGYGYGPQRRPISIRPFK